MDVFRSTWLGHSYFISPDCLVVQGWITVMLLSPINTTLAGTSINQDIKFSPSWLDTFHQVYIMSPITIL